MDEISFGQIVRERRDSLGLTQAELARRVGCATITVRKTEANDIRPSVQIAERLAEALGVPQAEQRALVRLARTSIPTGQGGLPGRHRVAKTFGATGHIRTSLTSTMPLSLSSSTLKL